MLVSKAQSDKTLLKTVHQFKNGLVNTYKIELQVYFTWINAHT